jgi:hypothetical protein
MIMGGVKDPVSALERHKSHLESDAHQTNGLGIEVLTAQVGPDRHCSENLVRTCKVEMSARSRVLIWVS